jgi:hypothetical protein
VNGAAIFAYHNFVERPGTPAPAAQAYVLSQAQFDAHLDALAAQRFGWTNLVSLTKPTTEVIKQGNPQLITDYTVAFARLAERGWPGCFFVIASQVGASRALGWRELREMAAAGMEIGSHSLTHPFLHRADPDEIRREFGESKRILEDGLRQAVHFASLPRGSAAPGMGTLIKELGYHAFCTSEPGCVGPHDPYECRGSRSEERRPRHSSADMRGVVHARHTAVVSVVKKLGKQLVGAERWRHIRGVLMDAAERARA